MNQLLSLILVVATLVGTRAQCPWEIDNTLDQPVLTLGGPYILNCPGDTLQFTTSAEGLITSFSWTGPNGYTSTQQDPDITDPGTYSLTVDYGGGCTVRKSVTVSDNISGRPMIDVQGGTLNCRSTAIRMRVTSDDPLSTFSWTGPAGFDGSTAPNPVTRVPGDYQVRVIDGNQCTYLFNTTVQIDTIKPEVIVDDVVAQSCNQASYQLAPTGISIVNDTPIFSWAGPYGFRAADRTTTTEVVGTYRLTIRDPINNCTASDVMRVIPHPDQPIIDLTPADVGCNTASDSMITSVSNCDNCEISWQGPDGFTSDQLAFEVTVETAGRYNLMVTEPTSGCNDRLSINITTDTIPLRRTFRDPPTPVACDIPGEVRLFIPQNFENITMFDVRGGEQVVRDRISLTQPGLVYVESTDINGCFQRDTFMVEERDDPVLVLNMEDDTLNCLGEPVTVGISSSNYGIGELTNLSWTFSDGSTASGSIVPVSVRGSFTIEATASNGCTTSIDTFVSIDFRQPTVEAFGGFFDCTQNGIELGASIPDPDILQTIWTGPRNFWTTTTNPTVLNAGTYTLEVTAQNGCTNTDTAEVSSQIQTLDSMQLLPADVNCAGDGQVLISNFDPVVDYTWRPASSNTATPFVGDLALLNGEGTFIIEGLHNPTSCLFVDSVTITVDTIRPSVSVQALDTIRCAIQEITVQSTVNEPVEYSWTTVDGLIVGSTNDATILASQTGTYRLAVTSMQNQCIQEAEIELFEVPSSLSDFDLEVTPPNCTGDHDGSISVVTVSGGNAPILYSLGGNQFSPQSTFRNLRDGEYQLIIEDVDGCSLDTLLQLDRVPTFAVDLGDDIRVNLGQGIELEADVDLPDDEIESYSWSFALADSCQNDCPVRSFTPIESNFYIVSVSSSLGCTVNDTIFVQVIDNRGLFVPNAITPNGDGINDFAEVFVGPAIASLDVFEIYDRWGTRVFAANDFNPGDPSARWDGSHGGTRLVPGVYIYTLRVTDVRGLVRDLMGEITLVR